MILHCGICAAQGPRAAPFYHWMSQRQRKITYFLLPGKDFLALPKAHQCWSHPSYEETNGRCTQRGSWWKLSCDSL